MAKKTTRKSGGARKRATFVLRLKPALADRLSVLAESVGVSRNQFIEIQLTALVEHDALLEELGDSAPSFGAVLIETARRMSRPRREVKHA